MELLALAESTNAWSIGLLNTTRIDYIIWTPCYVRLKQGLVHTTHPAVAVGLEFPDMIPFSLASGDLWCCALRASSCAMDNFNWGTIWGGRRGTVNYLSAQLAGGKEGEDNNDNNFEKSNQTQSQVLCSCSLVPVTT